MPTSIPSRSLRLSPKATRNTSGVSAVSALSSTRMSPKWFALENTTRIPARKNEIFLSFASISICWCCEAIERPQPPDMRLPLHTAFRPISALRPNLRAGIRAFQCPLSAKIGDVFATAANDRFPPLRVATGLGRSLTYQAARISQGCAGAGFDHPFQ